MLTFKSWILFFVLFYFLFQGFEGIPVPNCSTHSIHDRWPSDEDAGCNSPDSLLVLDWLDFCSQSKLGEKYFTHWPGSNIGPSHLQYVPHGPLGLHDGCWYVGFLVYPLFFSN